MRLGFVGTGTLTEAIITGLVQARPDIDTLLVSPRNAETSARLAAAYPAVRVAADNQAVLDGCDAVILAIRPQIAEEVIRPLVFRPDHHVISVVATVQIETLADWIGGPVAGLCRAVPLPFVAALTGPTLIFPPDKVAVGLFGPLGTAIETDDIAPFDRLATASALMGTYFGVLETAARWLEANGVAYEQGKAYLTGLYSGLAHAMQTSPATTFEELRHEFSTRGGLNEQVFRVFVAHGGKTALEDGLDAVLARSMKSS
ncbi:pyrroline-5-carboxylate reductase [Segnochrobactraceae bacterium EtOH-i3]